MTPSNLPIVPTCAVLFNSPSNVYYYNISNDTTTLLNVPGFTGISDIAHTTTRLWSTNAGSGNIYEWIITLSPFTAIFNRTIDIVSPVSIGPGLGAIDNNTLIAVNTFGTAKVITFDITTNIAVKTDKFNTILGRNLAGDILLTTTNKVLITNYNGADNYITQYDYLTGAVDVDILISPTINSPYGIIEDGGNIYILDGSSSNNVYQIDINPPYTITLVGDTGQTIFGGSQVPSCLTTHFNT